MKKFLNLLVIIVFSFLIVSCDNNKGPFETRKENGSLVLYSNNKLAKGWVEQSYTDFNSGIKYKISEIEYDKGLPTGKFKYYNTNGELFFDADLTGKEEMFIGTIKYGTEQDTILKGEFRITLDWIVTREKSIEYIDILEFTSKTLYNGSIDGPKYKFNHKNGKKDGTYQAYFNSGQLDVKEEYKNGNLGEWEIYYESGQLKAKGKFNNGKAIGEWKEYYENGKLKVKEKYSNGDLKEREEYWEEYYENGQLKVKGNYKNGKEDGEWEFYNENGKLILKNTYEDGLLVNSNSYNY